jgi:hypothetical protein
MHTHKAQPAKRRTYAWTACVSSNQCAAQPIRQRAHGGVTFVDECRCGATRKTEANGIAKNFGEWQAGGQK